MNAADTTTSATAMTTAFVAAARFHALAAAASRNGGVWVSAAGGTANVTAGIIARACRISFYAAHHALDVIGGEGWYQALFMAQPRVTGGPDYYRWDVKTVANAAVRGI